MQRNDKGLGNECFGASGRKRGEESTLKANNSADERVKGRKGGT